MFTNRVISLIVWTLGVVLITWAFVDSTSTHNTKTKIVTVNETTTETIMVVPSQCRLALDASKKLNDSFEEYTQGAALIFESLEDNDTDTINDVMTRLNTIHVDLDRNVRLFYQYERLCK